MSLKTFNWQVMAIEYIFYLSLITHVCIVPTSVLRPSEIIYPIKQFSYSHSISPLTSLFSICCTYFVPSGCGWDGAFLRGRSRADRQSPQVGRQRGPRQRLRRHRKHRQGWRELGRDHWPWSGSHACPPRLNGQFIYQIHISTFHSLNLFMICGIRSFIVYMYTLV